MISVETDIKDLRLQLANEIYAEDLFKTIEENRQYLRQWLPWVDQTKTIQDSKVYLRYCKQGYASQTQAVLLLLYNTSVIGTIGFNNLDHGNHVGEIGYWLAQKYQGNGLMSHAVKTLTTIGFERLGLNRLVIKAATENKASRAIATRLGFSHEGTARQAAKLYGQFVDLEIYSLLYDD